MYSFKLLESQLSHLKASYHSKGVKDWNVTFYSPSYVRDATTHLETLYDREKGCQLRPLTPDERAFVDNERLLSRLYYPYFAERYWHIAGTQKFPSLYQPNKTQKVMNAVRAEMEEKSQAIMIQQLKLRQLGSSTDTEACIGHRKVFYGGCDALVASSDPKKTRKLADEMIKVGLNCLPWWMFLWEKDIRERGEFNGRSNELGIVGTKEYASDEPWIVTPGERIDSKITLQHGAMMTGISRGSTPNPIHLTELPDFANPSSIVEGSMFNAIHEDEFTLVILESTAAMAGDWWHGFWNTNVDLWPDGKSRWRPLFLPWYLGTDIWPTPFWIEQRRDILERYVPNEKTVAHAERARVYVYNDPLLRSVLGDGWEMPKEQMMYWEFSREMAIKQNTVKDWLQEVGAADPDECFQTGGMGIFPYELITDYKAKRREGMEVFVVQGEDIPERLSYVPKDMREGGEEKSRRIVRITHAHSKGEFSTTLIPLRIDSPDNISPNGKLLVWERPQEGARYIVSYDDAKGVEKDNVAIEVIREATLYTKAEQVAEWAANNYSAYDAWPILLTLLLWYGSHAKDEKDKPLAVVELACQGAIVQRNIQERGWKRLFKRLGMSQGKTTFLGLGWETTPHNREIMMATLEKCVLDEWVQVNSKWLVSELDTLERRKGDGKVQARPNAHDDRALAFTIAVSASLSSIAPLSSKTQGEKYEQMQRAKLRRKDPTNEDAEREAILTHFTPTRRIELPSYSSPPIMAPLDTNRRGVRVSVEDYLQQLPQRVNKGNKGESNL